MNILKRRRDAAIKRFPFMLPVRAMEKQECRGEESCRLRENTGNFRPGRVLDEMDARGEIYWSPNGNPRRKIYLDASSGVPVQDIWLEFRDAHNQNIEITGYPTEKNPALLARIIEASSNPGDLVLDCFAGSGTTLAVASQLNRRWVGIDNSVEAISTTLRRFAKGLEPMGDFVSKQETQERSIQKPLLWESSEKLTEEVEGDKVASENGKHVINNFSLRAIESFTGDLVNVPQQWRSEEHTSELQSQ